MDEDPVAPLPPDDTPTGDPIPPPPSDTDRPAWLSGAPAETPSDGTTPSASAAPAYTLPTIDPSPSTAPKASGARKGITAAAVALAALVGVFAVKIVLGMVVGTAAANLLGSAFGGPWEHLPAETRDQLNQRADAALGTLGAGLSEDEKGSKLIDMGLSGLSRLDDQTLIRRVELYKAALDATDEATCAAIMRSSMTGPVSDDDAKTLVESFTTEQYGEWAEIWVRALEAEAAGAPPARTVSDGDSSAMFEAIFAGVPDDELATIQALSVGDTVTDPDACLANRALYTAGLALGDDDLAAFALTDVAP